MLNTLYPLKFHSILKEKLWGGTKLNTYLGKSLTSSCIGESWEISDVEGNHSIVSNGYLQGQSLSAIISTFTSELLGAKNYKGFGNKFPLLIKFIDAKQDLSIQLHPNDALAQKRHQTFGKTEMWHVVQADKGANVVVGFNTPMDKETYIKNLDANTLTEILNFDTVTSGDAYFIEAGRVHAIGAGVLLAEIQQTSDITYRIYDWDRVDAHGRPRELHTSMALDAINFDLENNFRVAYSKTKNKSNPMVNCPYFTTNYLDVNTTLHKQNTYDSFIIYICVKGTVEIRTDAAYMETIKQGETILLPASVKAFQLLSSDAQLLEVYI